MKNGKGGERKIDPECISIIDRNWVYHALKTKRRRHLKTERKKYKLFLKKEGELFKLLDVNKYNEAEAKAKAQKLEKERAEHQAQIFRELEYFNRCKNEPRQLSAYELSLYTV